MGWIIALAGLFPIWIGYLVKFKGKTEVIRIRKPEKIKDQKGYAIFMGENLIAIGVVAAIMGIFMEFQINSGLLGLIPTASIMVVMLRIIKGQKDFY